MTTAAEVDQAFAYAKAAGMEMIVGVPNHELLPRVEERVDAIRHQAGHPQPRPHGQALSLARERLRPDPRRSTGGIGLCIDVGHTQRCGIDPAGCRRALLRSAPGRPHQGRHGGDGRRRHPGGRPRRRRHPQAPARPCCAWDMPGTVSLEYEKDEKDPLPGRGRIDRLFPRRPGRRWEPRSYDGGDRLRPGRPAGKSVGRLFRQDHRRLGPQFPGPGRPGGERRDRHRARRPRTRSATPAWTSSPGARSSTAITAASGWSRRPSRSSTTTSAPAA